jgi:peptidoglycan/LPS O-acetylase OafA/YrhL
MKHRDGLLDLVRGVSALLVMLGHLRGFLFVDYGELERVGYLTKMFCFATGLGHQAVMVFFVLSGYFVGGSVLAGLGKGSFTWRGYAVSRLTRLWMVLIPALLLTLGIDLLGCHWNPGVYAGGLHASFMSGPRPNRPAVWDPVTLLGNLFFVQTIAVPVFGSNGPLWSLANEFWYYLMFPLGCCGLHALLTKRFGLGIVMLAGAGFLGWWLPGGLVASGLIWLMGAGVWWVRSQASRLRIAGGGLRIEEEVQRRSASPSPISDPQSSITVRPQLHFLRGWQWRVLGGALFLATLAATKTSHWLGSDYAVGTAFAVWMLALSGAWRTSTWWTRLVTGLSEISYTLYVVHFPLLFFVAAVVLNGRQFPADAQGYLWFAGLAIIILGIATGLWWLFERNTDTVRKWILGKKLQQIIPTGMKP